MLVDVQALVVPGTQLLDYLGILDHAVQVRLQETYLVQGKGRLVAGDAIGATMIIDARQTATFETPLRAAAEVVMAGEHRGDAQLTASLQSLRRQSHQRMHVERLNPQIREEPLENIDILGLRVGIDVGYAIEQGNGQRVAYLITVHCDAVANPVLLSGADGDIALHGAKFAGPQQTDLMALTNLLGHQIHAVLGHAAGAEWRKPQRVMDDSHRAPLSGDRISE